MKRFSILLILTVLLSAQAVQAVTPKEMDQARAIAAQAYLRYANDGSGYLDKIKPSSMADLEKQLKAKEKANIKDFKAVPVPKDYSSWTKEQLVDYWSVKAFADPRLSAKGKVGKSRARKNLNAMKVSAPGKAETASNPEAPKTETAPKTEPAKTETGSPVASATSEASVSPVASGDQPETTSKAETPEPSDSLTLKAEHDLAAAEQLASAAIDDETIEKADNHTWIYIVILCLLVGVVVALVVFASNVLKKNTETPRRKEEEAIPVISGAPDLNAMRDKFAATLNSKNIEIQSLNKKLESLAAENDNLKFKLERVTAEVGVLRKRLSTASSSGQEQAVSPISVSLQSQTAQPQTAQPQAGQSRTRQTRSIFLGEANQKGFFVRADRQIVPDGTVFRLDTTDGYSGSFRVANDPEIWENCLCAPERRLANACVAPDFTVTPDLQRVVTDSAGTAVLEDGHWKVLRKAKVHFE